MEPSINRLTDDNNLGHGVGGDVLIDQPVLMQSRIMSCHYVVAVVNEKFDQGVRSKLTPYISFICKNCLINLK